MKNRIKIFNIWVDPVSLDHALDRVDEYVRKGHAPHSIFAVNPEKNFSITKDAVLYEIFRNADLLIPDGIGVVMAARFIYGVTLSRVPGVDLMEKICELSSKEGFRVFVYGSTENVNKKAVEILKNRYRGLEIVGRSNGYVKKEQMESLITKINASKAEILLLALGSPKQEKWYATHKDRLEHVKVCQGVGGALDTIAGNVKRAPAIWCKFYLEWLYRLFSEPRRIKRQWAVPLFGAMILFAKMKKILNIS